MSDGAEIIRTAHARAEARAEREAARPRIDYAASNKLFKAQKAALTRAINSGDPIKVVEACAKAVREWDADHPFAGAWPDDWSRWQRALHDAGVYVQLEDLED